MLWSVRKEYILTLDVPERNGPVDTATAGFKATYPFSSLSTGVRAYLLATIVGSGNEAAITSHHDSESRCESGM